SCHGIAVAALASVWVGPEITSLNGDTLWSYDDSEDPNPYQTEHEELFSSIQSGNPVNDTEWAAKSTMTSIMGRMAVQSGKLVEWDNALSSDVIMVPGALSEDSEPPVLPREDGTYPCPIPGDKTQVI